MKNESYHIPVLLKETIDNLVIKENGTYLDCTLGGGGHTIAILDKISNEGGVLAIDRDIKAMEFNKSLSEKHENLQLENVTFSQVKELNQIVFGMKFDGILMDIGVSSKQIDDPERGFSYSKSGSLDMTTPAA